MVPLRSVLVFVVTALFAAAQEPLRLWLVLNEPPEKVLPGGQRARLNEFLEEWRNQKIDLFSNQPRALQDPQYAALLLGQRTLLRNLVKFRKLNDTFPPLEVRFFTWDEYFAKLQKSVDDKNGPDLVQVPSTWCISFASDFRLLAPLNISGAAYEDHFPKQIAEACKPENDNQLFGIPWTVDVRVLYFRHRQLPTLGKDLEQQHDRAGAFKKALIVAREKYGVPPFALPTARDWELLHQTSLLVWANEGDLITPQREWFLFPTHRAAFAVSALKGAHYIKDLLEQELIDLPRVNRDQLEREFVDGKRASIISGPWLLAKLAEQTRTQLDDEIGVALPPFGGIDSPTFVGGSFLGLTTRLSTSRKPLALELALFLTTSEQALSYALSTGLLPADKFALGNPESKPPSQPAEPLTYFGNLASITSTNRISTILNNAITRGKPYPRIRNWWRLEAPSQIGGLYLFWQDLAAGQPERELERDISGIAAEWDESLRILPWWKNWAFGAVLFAGVLGGWTIRIRIGREAIRRQRIDTDGLKAKNSALEQTNVFLTTKIAAQELAHSEDRKKLAEYRVRVETMNSQVDYLQKRVSFLEEKLSNLPGYPPAPPLPLTDKLIEIAVASYSAFKVQLRFNGKEATVNGQPGKVLFHLARTSLLEGAPVRFSGILGLLLLWHDKELPPSGIKGRLEVIVSTIRGEIRKLGVSPEIADRVLGIKESENGTYEFFLDESRCNLLLADREREETFVRIVRYPFSSAREKFGRSDFSGAFRDAVEAFRSERFLPDVDLPILLLLVRSFPHLSEGEVTKEEHEIYNLACVHLRRQYDIYSSLAKKYSADEVLEIIGLTDMPDSVKNELRAEWDRIKTANRALETVTRMSGNTDPRDPPEAIREEWMKLKKLEKIRGDACPEWKGGWEDCFLKVLRYWTINGNVVFRDARAGIKRINPFFVKEKEVGT